MAGKPDLSATQLAASGLATATATVGASYLGVAGTIGGAAFMSVASTAGVAIYKHFLDRGKDQIWTRTAQQQAVETAAHQATSGDPTRTVVWPEGAGRPADPAEAAGRVQRDADPTETRVDRPLGDPTETRPDRAADPTGTRLDGLGDDVTRMLGGAEPAAAHAAASHAAPAGGQQRPGQSTLDWMRRRWFVLAGASVAVFAVVMGGLTLVEAVTDKPVSALVGANDRKGTTFGNVGGTGHEAPAQSPSRDERSSGPATESPGTETTGAPGGTEQPDRRTDPPATPSPRPTTPPPTTRPSPPSQSSQPNEGDPRSADVD